MSCYVVLCRLLLHRPHTKPHMASEAISALKSNQVFDFMRVQRDDNLKSFLEKQAKELNQPVERLLFSAEVIKINRKDKEQKRALILTNCALYNFSFSFFGSVFSNLKRRIPYSDIASVLLSRSSDECLIQVHNDYDYRFVITQRAEVVEVVSKCYQQMCDKPLNVQFSHEVSLKDECKTKSDMVERMAAVTVSGSATEASKEIADEPQMSSGWRMPGVLHEGWLSKQKGQSDRWELKYFVLTSDRLSYHTPRLLATYKVDPQQVIPVTASGHAPGTAKKVSLPSRVNSAENAISRRLSSVVSVQAAEFTEFAHLILADGEGLDFAMDGEADLALWTAHLQTGGELQGWLMKKDVNTRTWRRSFMYLRNNTLCHFAMEPKGVLELLDGVGAHLSHFVQNTLAAEMDPSMPARSRFAHHLNVSESARIYQLAAASEVAASAWCTAIQNASRVLTEGDFGDEELSAELQSTIGQQAPEGHVTLVFTDVQNSTNLWEAVPDEMNQALETHDAIMRDMLQRYRGYEVKTEGDAFMAAFSTPVDSVLWCMAVQRELLKSDWPAALLQQPAGAKLIENGKLVFSGIRVRMGAHTGYPTCRRNPVTGRMDYFGPVVNLSARISDTAHGGQIVCSDEVRQAVSKAMVNGNPNEVADVEALVDDFRPVFTDHGAHMLKGIKEATPIFQIASNDLAARPFPPLRTGKK